MAKYIVTIEGFNDCKVVEFEADTPEDAEEIGRDILDVYKRQVIPLRMRLNKLELDYQPPHHQS